MFDLDDIDAETRPLFKRIAELEAERDRLREVLEAIVELGEKSPQSYQFNAEFHAAVYAARQALNKADTK